MRMNSALGKRILAAVRGADYAHAGEEEAIELAFAPIPKDPERNALDAGCGRAGTAAYVQARGWGRVSGFDLDAGSIEEARTRHPELDLRTADAASADAAFEERFALIYAFNAFYAFPEQAAALRALRRLASPPARLVLFDYVDRGSFAASEFGRRADTAHWRPLRIESVPCQLGEAGWKLDGVTEMHAEYERWYAAFVARIEARRDAIIALGGEESFSPVHDLYRAMHHAVRDRALGGATVYATAV
jgi:SAM-dependent methyltransferase